MQYIITLLCSGFYLPMVSHQVPFTTLSFVLLISWHTYLAIIKSFLVLLPFTLTTKFLLVTSVYKVTRHIILHIIIGNRA